MSANTVNAAAGSPGANQNRPSLSSALIDQGKRMLIGGAVGGVAGKAVSLAAPVSHKKIADQIVDDFIKHDKDGVKSAIDKAFELAGKKENNEHIAKFVKAIEESEAEDFSKSVPKIKEVLETIGENVPDGEELTRSGAIEKFKNYLKNNEVTEEQLKTAGENADNIVKNLTDKALGQVDDFFKTARKNRSKDDIVAIAKKCAKKAQSGKIIGTAILAGITTAIFSDLLVNIFPKRTAASQNQQAGQAASSLSKMGTHQG